VEAATSRQTSNGSNPDSDWDQGYGYQFWRCRHGAYRGDGAFGQYCIVLPEQDAVIAITSGVKDMQAVLNLIWDKLLPAFGSPLPPDSVNHARLQAKLNSLIVPPVKGQAVSPMAKSVWGRAYRFPSNERGLDSITLEQDPAGQGVSLVMKLAGGEQRISCGLGGWAEGRGSFGAHVDAPLAGSAAWVEPDTIEVKLCAFETPYYYTLKMKYSENELLYDAEANVGFGSSKQPQLVGRAN
jgi:hypothetical protein